MSFLDVDRSSFENKLLFDEDAVNSSLNSLMEKITGKPREAEIQSKLVTPAPGICVKTFTAKKEKVFINICHTEDIPPPKGSTIPMSIGNPKEVVDKNEKSCVAFDVAINSTFYNNNCNEIVLLTIIEGVANKHQMDLEENRYHVLKNVKYKGKIEPMNIEIRPAKSDTPKRPLITELTPEKNDTEKKPVVKPVSPDFNLIKIDNPRQCYVSEIDLKNITSKENISLEIGEDRVYLTTTGKTKYELQYHLPENVNNDLCAAEFADDEQILRLIMPLSEIAME